MVSIHFFSLLLLHIMEVAPSNNYVSIMYSTGRAVSACCPAIRLPMRLELFLLLGTCLLLGLMGMPPARRMVQREDVYLSSNYTSGMVGYFSKKDKALRIEETELILKKAILRMNSLNSKQNIMPPRKPNQSPTENKTRILILSYWRSGSTFIFELFRSYPGVFSIFEPLQYKLGINFSLYNTKVSSLSVDIVRDMFNCRMNNTKKYSKMFKFLREMGDEENYDSQLYELCHESSNNSICWDPDLHSAFCRMMPVTLQKTVRLGISTIPDLLHDYNLNLRIIVLMRDPRPMLLSREGLEFCSNAICYDAQIVCKNLEKEIDILQSYGDIYKDRYNRIGHDVNMKYMILKYYNY